MVVDFNEEMVASVVSLLIAAGGWRKKKVEEGRRCSVSSKKTKNLRAGIIEAIGKIIIINNKMRKCIFKLYILSCCVMMMCCFVSSFRP